LADEVDADRSWRIPLRRHGRTGSATARWLQLRPPKPAGRASCGVAGDNGGDVSLGPRQASPGRSRSASCEVSVGTVGYGPAEIVRALDRARRRAAPVVSSSMIFGARGAY
jgi:hypothetical protein